MAALLWRYCEVKKPVPILFNFRESEIGAVPILSNRSIAEIGAVLATISIKEIIARTVLVNH